MFSFKWPILRNISLCIISSPPLPTHTHTYTHKKSNGCSFTSIERRTPWAGQWIPSGRWRVTSKHNFYETCTFPSRTSFSKSATLITLLLSATMVATIMISITWQVGLHNVDVRMRVSWVRWRWQMLTTVKGPPLARCDSQMGWPRVRCHCHSDPYKSTTRDRGCAIDPIVWPTPQGRGQKGSTPAFTREKGVKHDKKNL